MGLLLTAVVTASLLGSLHCVGMCGPLAIWASGAGEGRRSGEMVLATSLYHLGRLIAYAIAGALAGAAGQLVDWGGEALGVQLVAARIVGASMVAIGGVRLWQLWRAQTPVAIAAGPASTSWLTQVLVRLRPRIFRLPVPVRGLVTGLLTALLPCGWLYLFALVAAGTGSWLMGPVVMAAFWLGTVPALIGLVTSTQLLAVRLRKSIPVAAAVLLIVGGCYTAAGRGFAQLHSLSDIGASFQLPDANGTSREPAAGELTKQIDELVSTPLPCCEAHAATGDSP